MTKIYTFIRQSLYHKSNDLCYGSPCLTIDGVPTLELPKQLTPNPVMEKFYMNVFLQNSIRSHFKSFHRKNFFDFFSIFFKHFSKQFCLLLKDLSCTSRKKSIFFKNKPCMKNPLVEKLDMVPYFTLLASLEVKLKFERQVRF